MSEDKETIKKLRADVRSAREHSVRTGITLLETQARLETVKKELEALKNEKG